MKLCGLVSYSSGFQFFTADMPTRKAIADVGISTFLKMLFVDNFVHADLHPGNILVRFRKDGLLGTFFTGVQYLFTSMCS
jgi:predicted unusual protein kinase regulating ubiquinone biosynthesis (AarF/ABC1/UbiB family)